MIKAKIFSDNNMILQQLTKWGKVIVNAPLKNYTTFKTGGPADFLIYPYSNDFLAEIIQYTNSKDIPLTIIGGGSNLLISDKGVRGIVIRMSDDKTNNKIEIINENTVYADAITSKKEFIEFCVMNYYCGIEFMVGIPGNIGGGIVMNAGTFMGTFSDVLSKIFYFNKDGIFKEKEIHKDMAGYRSLELDDAVVISGANFKLIKCLDIKQLKDCIAGINADRKDKHPLEYPSAGSVFKNPENHQAWKLINDTGLKGKKIGGAMVSEKHTNFIINTGDAASIEIKNLIEYVQEQVFKKFKVKLFTEIRMIGEF